MAAPRPTRTRAMATTTTIQPVAGPSKPRTMMTKAQSLAKKAVAVDVDGLAQAMDRALRIAEPEPQPSTRVVKPTRTAMAAGAGIVTKPAASSSAKISVKTAGSRLTAGGSKSTAVPRSKDQHTVDGTKLPTTGPVASRTEKRRPTTKCDIPSSYPPLEVAAPAEIRKLVTKHAIPSSTSPLEVAVSTETRMPTIKRALPSSEPPLDALVTVETRKPITKRGNPSLIPPTAAATPNETPRPNSKPINPSTLPPLKVTHPWTSPAAAQEMESLTLARAAMSSLNLSMRNIGAAITEGYRLGIEGVDGAEWTAEKVEREIEVFELALSVMRGLVARGIMASRGVEVERAGAALAMKLTGMGMYKRGMEQLLAARPHLLRLYTPQAVVQSATTKVEGRKPFTKVAASRAIPVKTKMDAKSPWPSSWYEFLHFPAAEEESEMGQVVKSILFQVITAAWVNMLGLDSQLDMTILHIPSTAPIAQLNPLVLALELPSEVTSYFLYLLCRRLSNLPRKTIHTTQLALSFLALRVSPAEGSITTADVLWDNAHSSIVSLAADAGGDLAELRKVLGAITSLIDWIERVRGVSGNKADVWYAGKGWIEFTGVWIDIARKVGDSGAIDVALSLMTNETRNTSPPPPLRPCTPPSFKLSKHQMSTPNASQSSRRSAKGKHKATDAEIEVMRLCGDLAKVELVLDGLASPVNGDLSYQAAVSALRGCSVVDLGDAILSLTEEGRASLGKTDRAMERIRRMCVQRLKKASREDANGGLESVDSDLLLAMRVWLIGGVEMVEDVLADPPMDLSDFIYGLVGASVDSLITLARLPHTTTSSTPQTSLSHLDRAKQICDSVKSITKDENQRCWDNCLTIATHAVGWRTWKQDNFKDAIEFAKRVCLWMESDRAKEGHLRRYDFYAMCLLKIGDKENAVRFFIRSLCAYQPTTYDVLSKAVSDKPLIQAFEGFPEVVKTLQLLVNRLVWDPPAMMGVSLGMGDSMRKCGLEDNGVVGGMLEKVMEMLQADEWRCEVAALILGMGRVVLGFYDKVTYPVRRLRVITRMMNVISASGVDSHEFENLSSEAKQLANVKVNGTADERLQPFRAEHYATALLLDALQAYHSDDSARTTILDLSHTAMAELRNLVLPPVTLAPSTIVDGKKRPLGRSATVKAPAVGVAKARAVSEPKKKGVAVVTQEKVSPKARSSLGGLMVFDDLKKVATLLGSLASLLGMLGHALAKVEALKLFRALLRGREDMADDYVLRSAELASEYHKLGKRTRASFVFNQALKMAGSVSYTSRVVLHLRHSAFLAATDSVEEARAEFIAAGKLSEEIPPSDKNGTQMTNTLDKHELLTRMALANSALASMYFAQDDASKAISCFTVAFRLWTRAAGVICRVSPDTSSSSKDAEMGVSSDDPFAIPDKPNVAGQDRPAMDDNPDSDGGRPAFQGKHVHGTAWYTAEALMTVSLELASANAYRGSVKECEYYLSQAGLVADAVKSTVLSARVNTRLAQLQFRLRRYDESAQKLGEASTSLNGVEGPDAVDIKRVHGELLSRQEMAEEAAQTFDLASKGIAALDGVFAASEALVPSPRKAAVDSRGLMKGREPLLSRSLAQVLRQQAWLFREAGMAEECGQLLAQIRGLSTSDANDADDLFLDGRIEMKEAFDHFKTDLWMSSLTESTIAMPMGNRVMQSRDRHSTRLNIQSILDRSEQAFLNLLQTASSRARVEDVRVACQSLAMLRAFKTSLGQGSEKITSGAAAVLASGAAITIQRELLEAIAWKLKYDDEEIAEDAVWPTFSPYSEQTVHVKPARAAQESPSRQARAVVASSNNSNDPTNPYRSYWTSLQTKYTSSNQFTLDDLDLSVLPHNWAVITVNVTEDRTTMFVSRHQRDHPPLVFCLPLDRQGRREGDSEEDLFTFDAAKAELKDIIDTSNRGAREAKHVTTPEGRKAWWDARHILDKRMEELLANMEFVWLGAFKTIFSPRGLTSAAALNRFRRKLEKTFFGAISPNHGHDSRKSGKIHLDDALVECFAALSSKCKDEEAEDLVYFILDIFQFYGVPVALAELDIDQIAIDVKALLAELESSRVSLDESAPEHILLALDKNAQPFPWESIPILRGRPVSRIPSLSLLLDQVALPSRYSTTAMTGVNQKIDARRVFYILNPSGDLLRTQAHFQPWLERTGWKGIIGRDPTELEMVAALRNHDLVVYIGHGGAEQYIRTHKVRHLPNCASVMLWGCSSGRLRDQGDLDCTGTAWNYLIAGSPSMTGNLWDVTDKDIDRLTEEVFNKLNLNAPHGALRKGDKPGLLLISNMSNVEAVATSRDECKLRYLTGAAPVVYGLPMYLH